MFNSCKAIDLLIKAWELLGSIFNALSNSFIPSSFFPKMQFVVPFEINEFIWFGFIDNYLLKDYNASSKFDSNCWVTPL